MTSAEVDVRVVPGARRSEIVSYIDGVLRVRVAAPAVDQKATRELERHLADWLGVRPRQVSVVSGLRARAKRIRIDGLDAADLRARLGALAPTPPALSPDDLPALHHDAK